MVLCHFLGPLVISDRHPTSRFNPNQKLHFQRMSSVLAAAWVPLALGALAGVVSVCVVIDNITDVWNEIDCEMEDFNKEYEEIWKDMERLTTARRDAVARRRRYYQPISGILGQDLRVVQSLTVDIGIPIPYPRSEGSCAFCVTSPRKCLPGDRGPKGIKGLRGPNGEDGTDGIQGIDAQDRENLEENVDDKPCFHCPTGPRGESGSQGIPGPRGMSGNSGVDGSPGRPGRNGMPGDLGEEGPEGAPGNAGYPGDRGIDGRKPIGRKGLKGVAGDLGPSGDHGDRGEDQIEEGQIGIRGMPGQQGADGRQGQPGKRGPAGDSGPIGHNGEYCACPRMSKDRKKA